MARGSLGSGLTAWSNRVRRWGLRRQGNFELVCRSGWRCAANPLYDRRSFRFCAAADRTASDNRPVWSRCDGSGWSAEPLRPWSADALFDCRRPCRRSRRAAIEAYSRLVRRLGCRGPAHQWRWSSVVDPCHRRRHGFSWSAHHGWCQSLDFSPPFCAASRAMRFHNGAIDQVQTVARFCCESIEDTLPHPSPRPAVEPIVRTRVRAIAFGQIAPRDPGPQHVKYCIYDPSIVRARALPTLRH